MKPFLANLVYYCSTHLRHIKKKERPGLLVWYKYKWRRVLKAEPILEAGKTFNDEYTKMLVWFEGLEVPRKLQSGVLFYLVYYDTNIDRILKLKQYWFQPHGPRYEDILGWYSRKYYKMIPSEFIEKENK